MEKKERSEKEDRSERTADLQVVPPGNHAATMGEFPQMTLDMMNGLVELSVEFERARDDLLLQTRRAVSVVQERARRVKEFADNMEADLDKNFQS
jgi:hypothetical protein